MVKYWLSALFIMSIIACTSEKENPGNLKTGIWRATIEIQGKELPFNFEVENKDGKYRMYIINADERLMLDEMEVTDDSIDVALHVFDANIKARIEEDSLNGVFVKNPDENYELPFRAAYGQTFRFEKGQNNPTQDFTGKYAVKFYNETATTNAIGVFRQEGDSVTGTFLTPTGDYRYLQGNVVDGRLQLSTFDGNHAYLFYATMDADGAIQGEFFSGKTFYRQWTGVPNDNPTLPDPEAFTYLKPGFETLNFSFPDLNGKMVSLTDEKFKNKVVVLQLFGSWCPNCMDETKFLSRWYDENKHRGVEILGLAYERKPDFEYARSRVQKMVDKFSVPYSFVIAGTNDKESASATLPELNQVAAFPTTIFVGRDGKVKKIHTGFAGPGTGEYYDQHIEEFNQTVNELLAENI